MLDILPLVSIIIPCYNHDKYIADAIQSIISQTYSNIELILIDDGSQDNSKNVIEALLDECNARFKRVYFVCRPNKGLCKTINEALAICQGKYVSLIASDDLMHAEKTAIQVSFLESHPEVSGVFAAVELIDDKNTIVGQRISERTEFSFEEIILNHHDLPTLTQMYHLDVILSSGGYDETVKIEDWYMLLKLSAQKKRLLYLPKVLCQYRLHDQSFSNDKLLMATEMLKIIQPYYAEKIYPKAEFRINKEILKYRYKDTNIMLYYFLKYKLMLKSRLGRVSSK